MIRRQSLNSIYLYLSEKAAADYIKQSQQRERERESHQTNEGEESCGRRLLAADFIYFFCFMRKNAIPLIVFNRALRIFILNKFLTNNNRLSLQSLG